MRSGPGRPAAAGLALAFLLAFSGRASAADTPAPAPAPRIAVEPAGFDFGAVRADRTVDKEFVIRNFGDAPLVISSVTTSCGCTVAKGWSPTVAAGSTTPLRVSLSVGRTPGPQIKSVVVKSNDPARRTLEIKLQATVVAGPTPSPAR